MIGLARILTALCSVLVPAAVLSAGEFRPAAHETWAGTHRCEAAERDPIQWPAFSSRVQLTLEGGAARLTRESARLRESLSGQVAADGTVKLEGWGDARDGGVRWRYRFDGKFEGERFVAKGAMLSASLATKLRDCSLDLRRVEAKGGPARVEPPAAASPPPKPAPDAQQRPAAAPAAVKAMEGKALDFTGSNNTAVMQGKVTRELPHRYPVAAKKGQTLSATLHGDGARLDIYEPGAVLERQGAGFVVQGARLGEAADSASVSAELPRDGKYLLLVRALGDEAPYTVEVTVNVPADLSAAALLSDERMFWGAALLALAILGAGLVIYSRRDRRMFRPR